MIVGNKSTGRHGVYKPKGTTRFVNCSIVGNQSGEYGGVTLLFNADEVVSVSNSIIWEILQSQMVMIFITMKGQHP